MVNKTLLALAVFRATELVYFWHRQCFTTDRFLMYPLLQTSTSCRYLLLQNFTAHNRYIFSSHPFSCPTNLEYCLFQS